MCWPNRIFLNYFKFSLILRNLRSVVVYLVCAGVSLREYNAIGRFACDIPDPSCIFAVSVWITNYFQKLGYTRRASIQQDISSPCRIFINFHSFKFGVWWCDIFQRRKNMCTVWPHILVIVNKYHEYLYLLYHFWRLEVGNGFQLIWQ